MTQLVLKKQKQKTKYCKHFWIVLLRISSEQYASNYTKLCRRTPNAPTRMLEIYSNIIRYVCGIFIYLHTNKVMYIKTNKTMNNTILSKHSKIYNHSLCACNTINEVWILSMIMILTDFEYWDINVQYMFYICCNLCMLTVLHMLKLTLHAFLIKRYILN